MRIAYCVNLRLPSERAYGHQIASVANAFVENEADVHIYAPVRKNPIKQDVWNYHSVDRKVHLTHVPAFDGIANPWTPGVIGLWLHNRSFIKHLLPLLKQSDADVIYTRSPALLSSLLSVGTPVVVELHTLPRFGRSHFVQLCQKCRKVICLTTQMRDELLRWGVPADLMMVEGDAVDILSYRSLLSKEEARKSFHISSDAFVVGYAGSLSTMGKSKGVEQLIRAIKTLPVTALIAGGPESERTLLEREAAAAGLSDRVHMLGQIESRRVLALYAASDVLVYTAPRSSDPYFMRDTSPLKIFEYMAVGKPIIAADIPPLHDVLNESLCLWYRPGDAESLAAAIRETLDRPAAAVQRVEEALERVADHTWTERMKRILSAIA